MKQLLFRQSLDLNINLSLFLVIRYFIHFHGSCFASGGFLDNSFRKNVLELETFVYIKDISVISVPTNFLP